jgi:hypothetical protein
VETEISSKAWRVARYWAEGRDRSDVVIRGFARQVQDHLDHQGDHEHLYRVAGWMSVTHPTCQDLDLAMRYAGAPQPEVTARTGHPCVCRGGSTRHGGAPAPPNIRQLIRRPNVARAA